MADETKPEKPLTDLALARLRKIAQGNGLPAEKIELIDSEESVYTFEGFSQLLPFCEQSTARYPGAVRGQERSMVADLQSLQEIAEKHQRNFMEGREWLPAAMEELQAAPGQGWGLDGAKISLPDKSVIYAANETCSACQGRKLLTCVQCQGQGFVVCTYCEGRGLELCYNCSGRGVNPAFPDQPCAICFGKKYAPCRFCHHSSGKLVCPTCQGKRGTACAECQGNGRLTVEIGLACGAGISFRLDAKDIPSGMRRGLDRLGITNIVKGHADVRMLGEDKPKDEPKEKDDKHNPYREQERAQEEQKKQQGPVIIRYEATMPYADLRLRIGEARAVMVNVFGKKAAMMGVPHFLDDTLKPWREELHNAGLGAGSLDEALKARAMQDAITLRLSGRGTAQDLRKLYPVGLSTKAAQDIMLDMRKALHHYTRKVRLAAGIACGSLGMAIAGGVMYLPSHAQATKNWTWGAGLALDLVVLAAWMGVSWVAIGKAVQFTLKKRFPKMQILLRGHAGYIGSATLAAIAFAWLFGLAMAPMKPLWLQLLLAKIGHS